MVTDDAAYAAFGRVIASSGSTENDFDWSAEPQLRRDPDTGYIHARRRDYDTLITRFLNPDPKAFDSGDPNFYRYAGNNPVNDADPSGLQGGRAPVNSRGPTHNQPTKSAGPVRPPDAAGRIAATRVDELVTQGVMSYFRGTDREYAVMVDACGDSIRAVVLKRYSFISVGRSSARYEHYQPVMNHPVLDLGIAQEQGTNIPEYIGRLRTRRSSDQYVELYLGRKETERLQWWASASEFALHAVPFGGTIDNVMQGNYSEAALSLAGDVTFFLGGGVTTVIALGGKATSTATQVGAKALGKRALKELATSPGVTRAALILEGTIGGVQFGRGLYAVRTESGGAAGYFGEAFLALVGVSAGTLRRYRQSGEAAEKAAATARASSNADLAPSTPPVIPTPGTGVTDDAVDAVDAVEALAKARSAGTKATAENAAPSGVEFDAGRVPGPNPNNLRQRAVDTPTKGEGGVYLKPEAGRTKTGSTNDFQKRYGKSPPDGIEVEIPQTRTGPPPGVDDSAHPWNAREQRRFDEEYVDRMQPPDVRYRDPNNPVSPVTQKKWEKYRHIFGYGDLPADFGY